MNGTAKHKRLAAIALALIALLLVATVAQACPGCKEAIAENDLEGQRVARGYFWSILFMMSMPFTILGTFGTYCYVEVRRARRDKEQLEQQEALLEAQEP
jgi:heme/copper-type cytochrome/quinol oxidase subunit 2